MDTIAQQFGNENTKVISIVENARYRVSRKNQGVYIYNPRNPGLSVSLDDEKIITIFY